jgi:putative ABC transport system ATP-binding protein
MAMVTLMSWCYEPGKNERSHHAPRDGFRHAERDDDYETGASVMGAPPEPRKPDRGDWAIRARDVHKAYRRGSSVTRVLAGIDLAVRPGECVYLAGPSGSGKSTLLSILGCILTPDRGEVRIFAEDLGRLDEMGRIALRRDRIGFVFQRFHLIRGLTALDNVCVPLLLRGGRPRAVRRRGRVLLEAVGLSDKARQHPGNLSAGQCQRVALARALAGDPDLVLADEPTASLDGQNGQEVMGLLRRLTTEGGKTAVVVTHDPRIFSFADRILRLENGRIQEGEGPGVSLPAGVGPASQAVPAGSPALSAASQVVSTRGDSSR